MAEDTFADLRKKLEETLTYPSVYMFKFILEAENRKIAMVESMFGDDAEIYTKESGKGNYISITVKVVMMSSDEIIDVYKKASEIKGVMLF